MITLKNKHYIHYEAGNRVIAVTKYKGKGFRGVATCHENDVFNLETGKKIAAARAKEKMLKYNRDGLSTEICELLDFIRDANAYLDTLNDRLIRAEKEYTDFSTELRSIIENGNVDSIELID